MLAPGGEFEGRSRWGDFARDSLNLYPEFVRELESESGVQIDFRRCGALELSGNEMEWQALQGRANRQREWGIAVEDAGPGRLYYPDDSAVNPRDLLAALRIACERRGVAMHEGLPVRDIAAHSGCISEPEPADAAVIAAGAWSSSIQVRVNGTTVPLEPAIPIRGHLVAFAPSGEEPGPIRRQGHTYLLQRSSGITIAGSTTEQVGFCRDPDPALFQDIERRARELMPQLRSAPRIAEWIGFRPGTASGEPQLGQLDDSPVYLAYGHYRNGILMAPRTASFLADAINANLRMDSSSKQAARR